MRESFRQAMAYLHTWLGLVLGFVLMVVFFFGSLSVFDREIDRWSIPETRAHVGAFPSFDKSVEPLILQVKPDPDSMEHAADEVEGTLPPADQLKVSDVFVGTNHRDPLLRMYVYYDVPNKPKDPAVDHVHVFGYAAINPKTGERLPADIEERLALGTRFFFPLHYMLHLEWMDLGLWIVGLAAMAMLAALVSGVIMHRRIFREFFTFRPEKATLRSTLDLHNMTGVLALPFLFVITFSGVLIFAGTYFPSVDRLMKPLAEAQEHAEATETGLAHDPSGTPAPMASVDAMMEKAKARWAERGVPGEVGYIFAVHVGDADGYVSISRQDIDRVANSETIHFKSTTGEILYEDPPPSPVDGVSDFLTGMHFQFFQHWGLRWLLFAGGLVGCACIATGFVFFVEKRKRKHAAAGNPGSRIVDALAVTTVTGMLVATAAMMLANRVLPADGPDYKYLQQAVFWYVWLAALAHAGLRGFAAQPGGISPAWAEQAWAAAALAVGAVVANAVTTGDHLVKTIGEGYWPVAGVDLVLLFGAAASALAARWVSRRSSAKAGALRPALEEPAHV